MENVEVGKGKTFLQIMLDEAFEQRALTIEQCPEVIRTEQSFHEITFHRIDRKSIRSEIENVGLDWATKWHNKAS